MSSEERDDRPEEPGEATPSDEEAGHAVGPEIEGVEELAEQVEAAAAEEGGDAPEEEATEEPAAEEPPAEEPAADEPAPEEPAADEPAAEDAPRERRPRPERRGDEPEEEVIPGMHLEPDLVLEEERREESEFGQYAEDAEAFGVDEAEEAAGEEASAEPAPVVREPLDLAADARYYATGKRKGAIARVILRPGEGTYSVNGRHLDEYFPRVRLQRVARQPLEAAGYHTRLDVVARIHGGGVSAQATALRHGVARALVEADPALRGELKRRGYLTRDPREKERKKAGLKKARKRPQFSKR
jgi:small subunit ribosomal protein S9